MAIIEIDGFHYDTSEYIEQLKKDIEIYGGDTLVWVITKQCLCLAMYKEYNHSLFSYLKADEDMIQLSMNNLLLRYEEENKPLPCNKLQ